MKHKQGQAGRSMVEMLGVLAIIGVLSVVGIAAFKTAMKRHQANEVMQEISIATGSLQLWQEPEFPDMGDGVQFATAGKYNDKPTYVKVTIKDKDVCNMLKSLASGTYEIEGNCE